MRRDCFADEVAIDFPSITSALDRMRAAFFGRGGDTEPRAAEVVVTPDEARRGLLVPCEVPVREICEPCGGRGEIWLDACPACGGAGEAVEWRRVEVPVRPGVSAGTVLRLRVPSRTSRPTTLELTVVVR